jgi:DNA-binding MarR family transcriptional regulator
VFMEELNYEKFMIYLRQCQNKIQKGFNEEIKQFHISSTHISIIMMLYHHKEGFSMSELSRLLFVDNALMTRNIKELEKIKYIYRNRENEFQRKYHICLTEEGKKIALKIQEILEQKQSKFCSEFTKQEQEILNQALHIIICKFNKKIEEGK